MLASWMDRTFSKDLLYSSYTQEQRNNVYPLVYQPLETYIHHPFVTILSYLLVSENNASIKESFRILTAANVHPMLDKSYWIYFSEEMDVRLISCCPRILIFQDSEHNSFCSNPVGSWLRKDLWKLMGKRAIKDSLQNKEAGLAASVHAKAANRFLALQNPTQCFEVPSHSF